MSSDVLEILYLWFRVLVADARPWPLVVITVSSCWLCEIQRPQNQGVCKDYRTQWHRTCCQVRCVPFWTILPHKWMARVCRGESSPCGRHTPLHIVLSFKISCSLSVRCELILRMEDSKARKCTEWLYLDMSSCDRSLHLLCEWGDTWVRWPLISLQAESQVTQTREFL